MFRTVKRLAAGFLIAVLLVGSFSLTSVEAAVKKPKNCRFVRWENTAYTSATIAWDKVSKATNYQVRVTWTDGSHGSTGRFSSSTSKVTFSGLHYKHVYIAKVRALRVHHKGKSNEYTEYSDWSNPVFITPWPKNVTARLKSSSSPQVKLSWNIIYGCNGYNVFMSTNPYGNWYWNLSTNTKAGSTSATVKRYRGAKLKKYQTYYLRVVTRRKRNGVFCTVPAPKDGYYQYWLMLKNA